MTPTVTRAQFLAIIKDDLPAIWNHMEQFHHCKGSSQMRCCEEFRCEPCHVRHIRQSHGEKTLAAYWYTRDLRTIGPMTSYGAGKKKTKLRGITTTTKGKVVQGQDTIPPVIDPVAEILAKMTTSDWGVFQDLVTQGRV